MLFTSYDTDGCVHHMTQMGVYPKNDKSTYILKLYLFMKKT